MANQTTERMKDALAFIWRGRTPQQAADMAGVKRNSIYASKEYAELKIKMQKRRERLAAKCDAQDA